MTFTKATMKLTVRTVATIGLAAASLAFAGVAGAERAPKAKKARVTWKKAPHVLTATGSAGAKAAKDPDKGKLRPVNPGELPEQATGTGRKTEVIHNADGSSFLIPGDDLMNDSVATRQADGSIEMTCGHGIAGHEHAEEK
jgi:hypothetical protein